MAIKNFYCGLCGQNKHHLVASKLRDGSLRNKIYRCIACAHVQLFPQPTPEQEILFYALNQQDKSAGKEISFRTLKENNAFDTARHVDFVTKLCHSKRSRFLDIGSGYGFFIDAMYRRGFRKVVGIEISKERRAISKGKIAAPLIGADIMSETPNGGPFDVITMFHVLEHMRNPVDFLARGKSLLSKGGKLVCEVPNVGELLLRTCKAYNDFYWIRAHLHYFSASTLARCFRKAGFKRVRVYHEQRYGLENLFHWLLIGKPQIKKPQFTMDREYRDVESFYKKQMALRGASDAIIAVGNS